MERDIWRIWNVRELLETIGPEKTIRELKKRCEAGAIVGCALYKQLILTWIKVALEMPDRGARAPAETFMAVAGEDVWVERVEQLHEKNPPKIVAKELVSGIPLSVQYDLREEYNRDFDRRVGRKIPTDPKELTKEDIRESKRITEEMHKPLAPAPKPLPPPAVEIPRKPPEVRPPTIPDLELMRKEIEERIRKMMLEKKGGGEGVREAPPPERKIGYQIFTYKDFKEMIDTATSYGDLAALRDTIHLSEVLTPDEKKELVERAELRMKQVKERIELARKIYPTPPKKEEVKVVPVEEIAKLPEEKRREIARGLWVREDGDALTEPEDYTQWIYADFEALIDELEAEDLWELYEHVGVSEKLAAGEADELRARIIARIEKGE